MSEDKPRCKASVWRQGSYHPGWCQLAAIADGYCGQHNPASVASRDAARRAKWEADREEERRRRIAIGLREASLDELRAEIARREGKS